jgi:hypothetical protein
MKITDLKPKIPRGGLKQIAKRLQMNETTISQYFNGVRQAGALKELEIMKETLKYLKEISEQKEELIKEIESLNP